MRLITLLNHCQHFPGFVYEKARLCPESSTIEIHVRPRRGSKPPNARWDLKEHKLFVCYELAADFADLYRSYGAKPMQVRALPAGKRKR